MTSNERRLGGGRALPGGGDDKELTDEFSILYTNKPVLRITPVTAKTEYAHTQEQRTKKGVIVRTREGLPTNNQSKNSTFDKWLVSLFLLDTTGGS